MSSPKNFEMNQYLRNRSYSTTETILDSMGASGKISGVDTRNTVEGVKEMNTIDVMIEDMQEKHKQLDKLTSQMEKKREADRSTEFKTELQELKKRKLILKDTIASAEGHQWPDNALDSIGK